MGAILLHELASYAAVAAAVSPLGDALLPGDRVLPGWLHSQPGPLQPKATPCCAACSPVPSRWTIPCPQRQGWSSAACSSAMAPRTWHSQSLLPAGPRCALPLRLSLAPLSEHSPLSRTLSSPACSCGRAEARERVRVGAGEDTAGWLVGAQRGRPAEPVPGRSHRRLRSSGSAGAGPLHQGQLLRRAPPQCVQSVLRLNTAGIWKGSLVRSGTPPITHSLSHHTVCFSLPCPFPMRYYAHPADCTGALCALQDPEAHNAAIRKPPPADGERAPNPDRPKLVQRLPTHCV